MTGPDGDAAVPAGPDMAGADMAGADLDAADVDPRFPQDRCGVAILGCGGIAQSAHLPAYQRYGVGVRGVWSRTGARTGTLLERFNASWPSTAGYQASRRTRATPGRPL